MWLLKDKEFLTGVAVIIGGGLFMIAILQGVTSKAVEEKVDCLPACLIDGVQYRPYPVAGECWCDVTKARSPHLDK